jgi:predicted HTH domain antitoxin
MQVVAARLPKEVAREIERIALEEKLDKSSVIARATDLYIREWRLRKAIRLFENGRVTALKAANLANCSVWEFLEELEKKKIPIQYSAEEFIEDFEAAQKG